MSGSVEGPRLKVVGTGESSTHLSHFLEFRILSFSSSSAVWRPIFMPFTKTKLYIFIFILFLQVLTFMALSGHLTRWYDFIVKQVRLLYLRLVYKLADCVFCLIVAGLIASCIVALWFKQRCFVVEMIFVETVFGGVGPNNMTVDRIREAQKIWDRIFDPRVSFLDWTMSDLELYVCSFFFTREGKEMMRAISEATFSLRVSETVSNVDRSYRSSAYRNLKAVNFITSVVRGDNVDPQLLEYLGTKNLPADTKLADVGGHKVVWESLLAAGSSDHDKKDCIVEGIVQALALKYPPTSASIGSQGVNILQNSSIMIAAGNMLRVACTTVGVAYGIHLLYRVEADYRRLSSDNFVRVVAATGIAERACSVVSTVPGQ